MSFNWKKDKNNQNTQHSILVEWNILVHSSFWHDEFFGFILPKKTLENSDSRHFFPAFSVWPLNKNKPKNQTTKPPKQYLPGSIRAIEWNDAKVTSFYLSKMKMLKHQINPKQLHAVSCLLNPEGNTKGTMQCYTCWILKDSGGFLSLCPLLFLPRLLLHTPILVRQTGAPQNFLNNGLHWHFAAFS